MTEWKVELETDRLAVYETGSGKIGYEKPARVLKDDERVLLADVEGEVASLTEEALEKIGAGEIWRKFRKVGIKVNLCGGLEGCPSTFTDPLVVEGIINHVRSYGAEPFVCEGDMRGFVADERLVGRRGELADVLERTGTFYVNLSRHPIPFVCHGLDERLTLPEELIDPDTAIVSAAVPKDHWECGISMAQKNMYGAISDRRKAIFHRKWNRIDKAVAAAARLLRPELAVVGGRLAGAGWGPHFCVPVEWNRVAIGTDPIRVDGCMSEVYGYPYEKVVYAMINAGGEPVGYRIMDGSADLPHNALKKLKKHAMSPGRRRLWKALLYPQYFIPHRTQHEVSPRLEAAAGAFHHRFVDRLR